jgi:peroxiredoxin
MLAEGDTAPDFTLPGTEGDSIAEYSLTESVESGAVVLVFYPFDFSGVCTRELCSFRDAEFLTFTEGLDVFGLSLDSCYAHRRFIRQNDLNFPLLSDTRGRVTDAYGLAHEELNHHEGVSKRALVTVDDTRTVRYAWKTEEPNEEPSLDELHQTVKALDDL